MTIIASHVQAVGEFRGAEIGGGTATRSGRAFVNVLTILDGRINASSSAGREIGAGTGEVSANVAIERIIFSGGVIRTSGTTGGIGIGTVHGSLGSVVFTGKVVLSSDSSVGYPAIVLDHSSKCTSDRFHQKCFCLWIGSIVCRLNRSHHFIWKHHFEHFGADFTIVWSCPPDRELGFAHRS
jgi:hypothetical protein